MREMTFRIWRGDSERAEFHDYKTEVTDGMEYTA